MDEDWPAGLRPGGDADEVFVGGGSGAENHGRDASIFGFVEWNRVTTRW